MIDHKSLTVNILKSHLNYYSLMILPNDLSCKKSTFQIRKVVVVNLHVIIAEDFRQVFSNFKKGHQSYKGLL